MRSDFRWVKDLGLLLGTGILGFILGRTQIFGFVNLDISERLQSMPIGSLYLDKDHNTLWSKPQANAVSFVKIPDPEQAQIISNFSPANLAPQKPIESETTTTTTLPGGKK